MIVRNNKYKQEENMDDIWIPIIMFLSILAAIYFGLFFSSKKEEERQSTIRAAIDKGQELTPEIISSLAPSPNKSKYRDLRIGLPIIGLSIGWMLFGMFGIKEPEATWAAAFPLFFGLGFVLAWYISSKES